MGANGYFTLIAVSAFETIRRSHNHIAENFAFESDQRHFKTRREIVFELLALAGICARRLNFQFAPLLVKASKLRDGIVILARGNEAVAIDAGEQGVPNALWQRSKPVRTRLVRGMLRALAF